MRHFTAAIALLFIFSSCKENSDNSLMAYRIAEEGLQRSNDHISSGTSIAYREIESKLLMAETKVLAAHWQPKAMEIKKLSDSMVGYIRRLKEDLKVEAGGDDPKNKDWQNSLTVSEHLFESHGKGKELFEKLIKYKETILALVPDIKSKFERPMQAFSNGFNLESADTTAFTKTFFSNMSVIAAYIILSKLENNVRICESDLVTFCNNQIGYVDGDSMMDSYGFLIGQSSTYLKVGEELDISAGMGGYTTINKPKISINGKNIPIANGVAEYKLTTPLKAGKYYIPINIEFLTKDGKKEMLKKTISYTVAE